MSKSEEARKVQANEGEALDSPSRLNTEPKANGSTPTSKKKLKIGTDNKDSPNNSRNGSRKNSDENTPSDSDTPRSGREKNKRSAGGSDGQKSKFNYNTNNNKPKKSYGSILKKSKNNDETAVRQDANGNPILRGSRKHKISFKDKVDDIKIVENWKEYNQDNYTTSTCYCNIY